MKKISLETIKTGLKTVIETPKAWAKTAITFVKNVDAKALMKGAVTFLKGVSTKTWITVAVAATVATTGTIVGISVLGSNSSNKDDITTPIVTVQTTPEEAIPAVTTPSEETTTPLEETTTPPEETTTLPEETTTPPEETTTPLEETTTPPEETTAPPEETTPEPHVHTEEPIAAIAPTCTETGLTEGKKCADCGEILVSQTTVNALGHTEIIDNAVAPTCISTGLTEGKHCSVCNKVLVAQETVKVLGHAEVVDKAVAPSCTATGLTEGKHCSRCSTTLVAQNTVAALGHVEVIDSAVASTCISIGLTEGKHCSTCGEVLVAQRVVPQNGHSFREWYVIKEATEAEKGEKRRDCGACGEFETSPIAELAHDHNNWDVIVLDAVNPTCTTTGLTEGKKCSGCNEILVSQTVISAFGHVEVIDNAVAATCTATGLTQGKHCSRCSTTLVAQNTVAALGHVEVIDNAVAATCTSTGLTEGKHCSRCSTTLVAQNTVPALGHVEVIDNAVAATCTDTGLTKGKHCSVCNKVLVAQETINALGHTEVIDSAVAATCTATGLTEGLHCSVCNAVLIAQETVNALGHTEIIDKAVIPTCTETGLTEGKHCSVCNEVLVAQTTVNALGHNFGEWYTVKEATETEKGEKRRDCKMCDKFETSPIAELAHSHNNWAITVLEAIAPTCTTTGLTEGKQCSGCHEILVAQTTINALGHTEVIDNAVAPTCTATGLTQGKHCSVCAEVLVAQETISALGHKMSQWSVVDSTVNADDRKFERVCGVCEEVEQINLYERFADLTYVTFGDSITYGIDGVNWGLMEDPYPELVSNALGFKAFNNLAVSGATYCENRLGRTNMTQNILSFTGDADIISLMLGVNDCYVGLPLGTTESRDNTTIYGSLFLISEYLTQNYEDALIFYMTPFPYRTCYTNNSAGYKLEDVANAIKYVAALYDIPVLDMYLYSEYESNGMNLGDGLHPSQNFMREFTAPKIVKFIKEHYGVEYKHQHTEVIDHAVAPTCTETGLTEGKHCSVCSEMIVAQTTISALGHSYSATVIAAPTATENGQQEFTCSVCGDSYIDALIPTNFTVMDSNRHLVGYTGVVGENLVIPAVFENDGIWYRVVTIERAFDYCSNLTSVTIPNSVTSIGNYAFYESYSLTTVIIPDSVISIGTGAFSNCENLKSIKIPSGVTKISQNMFSMCKNLETIEIPEGVTVIASKAFFYCIKLTNITIPNSVTSIGQEAFKYCKALTNITLPENIATIYTSTFSDCTSLTSITIPSSVLTIGNKAFVGCNNLTSVEFAANSQLEGIETDAFKNCNKLATIVFNGTISEWNEIPKGSNWISSQSNYVVYCTNGNICKVHTEVINKAVAPTCTETGLTEGKHCSVCNEVLVAQETVNALGHTEVIDKAVVPTCTAIGLTEGKHCDVCGVVLVAQETVDALGHNYVDRACTMCGKEYFSEGLMYKLNDDGESYTILGLGECTDTDIVIPATYEGKPVTVIGGQAFFNKKLTSVIMPDSITTIKQMAFMWCTSLTHITISKNVTVIEQGALAGCTSLISFYVDEENKAFKTIDDNVYTIDGKILVAYALAKPETEFVVPDGVEFIGRTAFGGGTALNTIILPKSLTYIGQSAFYGNENLKSIIIPAGVTTMEGAFYGCTDLTIYCEVECQLDGWQSDWNNSNRVYYYSTTQPTSEGNFWHWVGGVPTIWEIHIHTEEIIPAVESTCTTTGLTEGKKCSVCNEILVVQSVIDALGHTEVTDKAVAPTCTATGLTEGKHCSVCNEVLVAQELVPALGHSYASTVTPPTATENGSVTYTCVCDDTYTEVIVPTSFTVTRENRAMVGFTGKEGENLAIPAVFENDGVWYRVETIGGGAFSRCENLRWVNIPNSVTNIQTAAFSECFNLVHVTIPDSVRLIESLAFYFCRNLENVRIGNGVTHIGVQAFLNCGLMSLVISNSVTEIAFDAFRTCLRLENITYEGTLAQWNAITFGEDWRHNVPATHITCSDGVVCFVHAEVIDTAVDPTCAETGLTAGKHCSVCNEVLVAQKIVDAFGHSYSFAVTPPTATEDGYTTYTCSRCGDTYTEAIVPTNFTITSSNRAMVGYTSEENENFVIPAVFEDNGSWYRITTIGGWAFSGCSNLTIVTIPESVTAIGDCAFQSCTNLTSVTIPYYVTTIGNYAFRNCNELKSMAIPAYIITIGKEAFYNCDGITSVTIPSTVTTVGSRAFSACDSLTSIIVDENNTAYQSINGNLYSKDGTVLVLCTTGKQDTSLVIPSTVTTIGNSAFYHCSKLTSITIKNSVTAISNDAFYGCINLTSINFENTIAQWNTISKGSNWDNSTGKYTIYCTDGEIAKDGTVTCYQHNYSSTITPPTATENGSATYTCSNCGDTYTEAIVPTDFTVKANNFRMVGYTGEEGENLVIPAVFENNGTWYRVTGIESWAFATCTNLTSITIPDSVTNIGEGALTYCCNLTSITLPFVGESVKTENDTNQYPLGHIFGTNSYSGGVATHQCYYNTNKSIASKDYYIPTSLKSVTITGGNILYGAFYNCSNLTNIMIGDSVTSIGDEVFYNCSNLTTIMVSSGNTAYEAKGNCVIEKSSKTLIAGCNNSIIPTDGSVTIIGYNAFRACSKLTSITIPDSVKKIDTYAFCGCSSLTSITIPDSVTRIGRLAFFSCSNLSEITFEDTSTWYRINDYSNWNSMSWGTSISVTNASTNVTYFTSTYYNYYWYKK